MCSGAQLLPSQLIRKSCHRGGLPQAVFKGTNRSFGSVRTVQQLPPQAPHAGRYELLTATQAAIQAEERMVCTLLPLREGLSAGPTSEPSPKGLWHILG